MLPYRSARILFVCCFKFKLAPKRSRFFLLLVHAALCLDQCSLGWKGLMLGCVSRYFTDFRKNCAQNQKSQLLQLFTQSHSRTKCSYSIPDGNWIVNGTQDIPWIQLLFWKLTCDVSRVESRERVLENSIILTCCEAVSKVLKLFVIYYCKSASKVSEVKWSDVVSQASSLLHRSGLACETRSDGTGTVDVVGSSIFWRTIGGLGRLHCSSRPVASLVYMEGGSVPSEDMKCLHAEAAQPLRNHAKCRKINVSFLVISKSPHSKFMLCTAMSLVSASHTVQHCLFFFWS